MCNVCLRLTVHICDVRLQDILRTGGLVTGKAATKDSRKVDILKHDDRTVSPAAGADDKAKADKTSDKPKQTRLSSDNIDITAAAVADDKSKPRQNISEDEKPRQRRRRSGNDGCHDNNNKKSSPRSVAVNTSDAALTVKEAVVVVSEIQRRRSRQTDNVMNVPVPVSQPVNDHLGSGSRKTHQVGEHMGLTGKEAGVAVVSVEKVVKRRRSRPSNKLMSLSLLQPANEQPGFSSKAPGEDVSYGSEAVEDVIQRLLDTDELMDDVDQPSITSPPASTAAVSTGSAARWSGPLVSPDGTRRSREVPRKTGKSPSNLVGTLIPAKSPPGSVSLSPAVRSPGSVTATSAAISSDTPDVSRSREVVRKTAGRSLRSSDQLSVVVPTPGSACQSSAVKSPGTVIQTALINADMPSIGRSRDVARKTTGRSPRSVSQLSVGIPTPGSASQSSAVKSPGSVASTSAVVSADTSGQSDVVSDTEGDTSATEAGSTVTSSGPRIKHVCRYASIALGKPVATFPPVTSSQLQLSALPSQEKERILVEKFPGTFT